MTSIRSNTQVRTHHADRRHTECETTPAHQSRRGQRVDGFERTSTDTTRPTTGTSSLDAAFNFSIDVGGQRIEGNLLELILAAVLEKMLGTLGGETQPEIGQQVTGDGRQYVVEPGDTGTSTSTVIRPDATRPGGSTSTGSTPETWPSWPSGNTGTGTTPGATGPTGTTRGEIPADLRSADGGANITSAADIDRLPIWESMHPNAVSFYKNKIREQLAADEPSTLGISGLTIHIGGSAPVTPTTTGATSELDRLPIWTSEWDAPTTAAWKQRMAADSTPIAGKLAALDKFRAFQQELSGQAPPPFNSGYQSGYVHNMFITGAIYNPRFYELGREQKQFITSEYQRLLGRPPSRNEQQKWMYLSPNMTVNESEFTKLKAKFATMTPAELTASVAERFTDREIADGVRAYLQANPGATEAQIRQVATSQYGVSSTQLDRVKRDFFPETAAPAPRTFTDREVADGVRAYIQANPGATEAQIRQVATSQYGVSSAQLDRVKRDYFPATPAPTTTTPAPRTYTDREVADGVRAYIQANPGATEAQIRQVATSQYGVTSAQLDRVKRDYFPATPAPTTTTPTTTPAPSTPTYTDAQVADGVRAYIAANPGATEAQIRQVAMSQYGVSSAQLDRVKRTYFS